MRTTCRRTRRDPPRWRVHRWVTATSTRAAPRAAPPRTSRYRDRMPSTCAVRSAGVARRSRRSPSTWLTAEVPRSWVALIRAKRSASGAGARRNPRRSPPQNRLPSEPTRRSSGSPSSSGRAAAGRRPSEVGQRPVLDHRHPRLGEHRGELRVGRAAEHVMPVGLCTVGCRYTSAGRRAMRGPERSGSRPVGVDARRRRGGRPPAGTRRWHRGRSDRRPRRCRRGGPSTPRRR